MSAVGEFFRKLFGIKKKSKYSDVTIQSLIEKIFNKNLSKLMGSKTDFSIEEIKWKNLSDDLSVISSIYFFNTLSDETFNNFKIIIPDEAFHNFKNKYFLENDDLELFEVLDGGISSLFYMHENHDDSNFNFDSFFKILDVFDMDVHFISWMALSSSIYKIRFEENEMYFLVDKRKKRYLEKLIPDKKFHDFLNKYLLTEKNEITNLKKDNDVILFNKSYKFPLTKLFFPKYLNINNNIFISKFERLFLINDLDKNKHHDGIWVLFILEINNKKLFILYLFRCESSSFFDEKYMNFKLFIKEIIKSSVDFLKSVIGKFDIKIGLNYLNELDKKAFENKRLIGFDANLSINSGQLNCTVFSSVELLKVVLENIKQKPAVDHNLFNNDLIKLSMLLNQRLIKLQYKEMISTITKTDVFNENEMRIIPFYKFLELIEDDDLKIIIQNYLILKFSIKKIVNSFYIRIGFTNDNYNLYYLEYNEDRILHYLPDLKKEDWEVAKNNINGIDKIDFITFNEKVMKDIYELSKKNRLIISQNTKEILKKYYYDICEEQYKIDLEKLVRDNVPFKSIDLLSNNEKTIFLNQSKNKELSIVIMFSEDKKDLIYNFLSKKKQVQMDDDLEFYKSSYNDGNISLKEIIKIKKGFEENVRKYLKRV